MYRTNPKRSAYDKFICNVNQNFYRANKMSEGIRTYLLTLWSIIFLEKLIGSQLVKIFLAFYGTQRCSTAFTSARHVSKSETRVHVS